ncbi:hypothetical protein [Streptomyces sp. NPDC006134]|uniref:hypothetical protein n=1 Tax=Streptomyces sp. NPDC006134 TaxID=3154467 RepID=UPI0033F2AF76
MSHPDEEQAYPLQAQDTAAAAPHADYYFPVEVVMAGDIPEETKNDIVQEVWNALHRALS